MHEAKSGADATAKTVKPPRLKPGDTVALLSPSWGGPALFPHVYENGKRVIEEVFGLKTVEYPGTRMPPESLHADPRLRASDINAAFLDDDIKAIVATIGGSDSIRILEHLDTAAILSHPKIIMGFSDTTTLIGYLSSLGLVTFHGPAVMAGFSQLANFPDAVREYRSLLLEGGSEHTVTPFENWSDAYQSWNDPALVGKVDSLRTCGYGHRWIHKAGCTQGKSWGGCIEVLDWMNGTAYWPRRSFWKGTVLFLETSEDKPSPDMVGCWLRSWGVQGILSGISGLILAKPKGYSEAEKLELDDAVLSVVVGEFGRLDLNIVTNVDFGHTDPRHIIPMGIELSMDAEAETICFTESPFS